VRPVTNLWASLSGNIGENGPKLTAKGNKKYIPIFVKYHRQNLPKLLFWPKIDFFYKTLIFGQKW